MIQFKPILAALRKHRLATLLIALEIALACAVLCNAASIIATRVAAMNIVSGVDESSLGIITVTGYAVEQTNDVNARLLAGLRTVPGVESVHVVSSVPFGSSWGVAGISLDRKTYPAVVEFYEGEPGVIQALGLKLVAGHLPVPDDYQAQPDQGYFPASSRVLVSQQLAHRLWPDGKVLGQPFWSGDNRFEVIGVVAHLTMAHPVRWGKRAPGWSVFVPARPGVGLSGTYLIRARPQDLERAMVAARAKVRQIAPDVVLDLDSSHTVDTLRQRYFKDDRAMAGLLLGVIAALLLVTALGIVGLASFWVAQRRRQIGIRRAVGATRRDILHYFQAENFLIVGFGIGLGLVLAVSLNLTLMHYYELARLPWWYLPVAALALWLLGQAAVLAPALRAARVPPVVATRSV